MDSAIYRPVPTGASIGVSGDVVGSTAGCLVLGGATPFILTSAAAIGAYGFVEQPAGSGNVIGSVYNLYGDWGVAVVQVNAIGVNATNYGLDGRSIVGMAAAAVGMKLVKRGAGTRLSGASVSALGVSHEDVVDMIQVDSTEYAFTTPDRGAVLCTADGLAVGIIVYVSEDGHTAWAVSLPGFLEHAGFTLPAPDDAPETIGGYGFKVMSNPASAITIPVNVRTGPSAGTVFTSLTRPGVHLLRARLGFRRGTCQAISRAPVLWTEIPLTNPPDGYVVLAMRVDNSNAVLDDAWDIRANGTKILRFNGAPETDIKYYAYIPRGYHLDFDALCAINQNDNYFVCTLYDNDVEVESIAISDDPPVGTIVPMFSYTVPSI